MTVGNIMTAKKNAPRDTKTAWNTSIRNGDLYFEDVRQCSIDERDRFEDCIAHEKAIRLISLDSGWFQREWLGDTLVKSDLDFELTLRAEKRSGVIHWYAYRRVLGVLHKRYVGQSDRLTAARLIEICRVMPTTKVSIRKD